MIAPDAKLDDGQLDRVLISKVKPLRRVLNLLRVKAGTHPKLKEVEIRNVVSARIHAKKETPAHLDGEVGQQCHLHHWLCKTINLFVLRNSTCTTRNRIRARPKWQ